jgi:protein TonB
MMLAYTASRPAIGKRESNPHALLIVISAHVALVAVVMSAKMELPARIQQGPPLIFVPPSVDPPPEAQPVSHPIASTSPAPIPQPLPLPLPTDDGATAGAGPIDPGMIGGGGVAVIPEVPHPIAIVPIHHDPRLLTPSSELKPPYPESKILSEEEAVLTLRLTIDERGRVVAVEPVGRADPEFLNSARRYLLARWRYQPATDDGHAVASSMVITLRFQLNG